MTFNYEYETDIELDCDYREIMTKVINESIDYESCPYEVEVNCILTNNDEIKVINQEYRGIDHPTDVLSFPMIEYNMPSDFNGLEDSNDNFNPDTGELLLGDIIISVEKVMEQAALYGHSVERELAFLTAHSMLHLFGYDHMVDEERLIMEKKQEEILSFLGFTR
ncbi:putative rRNA maturation factor [Mobilisporobacter senegalensis]|uniref:Endoribonuclease YbeY n=1 Tax=Mobilisporobacter senegalensis TaxID=1329262 RepID=A0A3N1XRM9_9FIRM|nr:rRNA maturation RNase YbeY [Mobilisporobacter senegalensis]ROR29323.1 putative rRNA maturation factor [Mobilisporobacter senegalensis]